MNYTILSKTGWKAKASTFDEAKAIATAHKNEWATVGVMAHVEVYYYDGTLVFSA